jgi:hypothetical protein
MDRVRLGRLQLICSGAIHPDFIASRDRELSTVHDLRLVIFAPHPIDDRYPCGVPPLTAVLPRIACRHRYGDPCLIVVLRQIVFHRSSLLLSLARSTKRSDATLDLEKLVAQPVSEMRCPVGHHVNQTVVVRCVIERQERKKREDK